MTTRRPSRIAREYECDELDPVPPSEGAWPGMVYEKSYKFFLEMALFLIVV